MSAQHTPGPQVRFHVEAIKRGLYGIQPIGTRMHRGPSIAEVLHFETCHAAGAYSAVNMNVPAPVPVWQYVDPAERVAAARKCAAISKAEACCRSVPCQRPGVGPCDMPHRAAIARATGSTTP